MFWKVHHFSLEDVSCHVPTKVQIVLQGPLHFGRSYHISMYCFTVHQLGFNCLSSGKGQCVLQRLLFFKSTAILHMHKLQGNLYLQNSWEWNRRNQCWPIAYNVNVIWITFVLKFLTLQLFFYYIAFYRPLAIIQTTYSRRALLLLLKFQCGDGVFFI